MEKLITILFIMIFGFSSHAQLPLSSVDFKRIAQKKVRQLVKQQHKNGAVYFSDLKSACYSEQDSSNYSFQETNHPIKEKIQSVWNKLKYLKPRDEFSGKMVSFGFLYSSKLNRVFYSDDDYQGFKEGEIVYLNLKLLGGIKNIGVALEVTKVDEDNKTIQFCYLENGMSMGTQEIKLTETKEGETLISQATRYRNHSRFREKRLYPIFHQKAVRELHKNIRNLIETFPSSANNL